MSMAVYVAVAAEAHSIHSPVSLVLHLVSRIKCGNCRKLGRPEPYHDSVADVRTCYGKNRADPSPRKAQRRADPSPRKAQRGADPSPRKAQRLQREKEARRREKEAQRRLQKSRGAAAIPEEEAQRLQSTRADATKRQENAWGLKKARERQDRSTHAARKASSKRERDEEEAKRDREYEQKRAERASVVRKAEEKKSSGKKYKFRCKTCNRTFFAKQRPWPRCNKCQNDLSVVCVCSGDGCQKEFLDRMVDSYCSRCDDRSIRESFGGGISSVWKRGKHSKGT